MQGYDSAPCIRICNPGYKNDVMDILPILVNSACIRTKHHLRRPTPDPPHCLPLPHHQVRLVLCWPATASPATMPLCLMLPAWWQRDMQEHDTRHLWNFAVSVSICSIVFNTPESSKSCLMAGQTMRNVSRTRSKCASAAVKMLRNMQQHTCLKCTYYRLLQPITHLSWDLSTAPLRSQDASRIKAVW